MEAVIGDTQQGGCLLSLKEEKEEKRDGGVRRREMNNERERGKIRGRWIDEGNVQGEKTDSTGSIQWQKTFHKACTITVFYHTTVQ